MKSLPYAYGRNGSLHPFQDALAHVAFIFLFIVILSTRTAFAVEESVSNCITAGKLLEQSGDVANAMKCFRRAGELAASNQCAELCVITQCYCDLMHETNASRLGKILAEQALASALRAVKADEKSATAHLCVAVCYAKNFPYADNETRVKWSRLLKTECETAIALDPTQDVGYYMLGRWHEGVANMNFFTREMVKIVYGGLPKASNAEAIRCFKKAIELAPSRIIHHSAISRIYHELGDKKSELAELEKCRDLKPVDQDDVDAQNDARERLARFKK